jgi:hypothetical protein
MTTKALSRIPAALAAALLAAPASAATTAAGHRPLSLPAGAIEVIAPLNVGASGGAGGEPVSLNPSVYYGVTDSLTVGLRHFVGVCVAGEERGCRTVYDDASLDAIYALGGADVAGGRLDLASGAALNAGSLDPLALGGELRLQARYAAGRFAAFLTPTFGFGLTERDTILGAEDANRLPLAFPLYTTGGFGWYWEQPARNREWMAVPLTVVFAATDRLSLAAGVGIAGALDEDVAPFDDAYVVPAAVAASYALRPGIDLGASLTLPSVAGPNEDRDVRGFRVFGALRF